MSAPGRNVEHSAAPHQARFSVAHEFSERYPVKVYRTIKRGLEVFVVRVNGGTPLPACRTAAELGELARLIHQQDEEPNV